jgi:hypothetical protein
MMNINDFNTIPNYVSSAFKQYFCKYEQIDEQRRLVFRKF